MFIISYFRWSGARGEGRGLARRAAVHARRRIGVHGSGPIPVHGNFGAASKVDCEPQIQRAGRISRPGPAAFFFGAPRGPRGPARRRPRAASHRRPRIGPHPRPRKKLKAGSLCAGPRSRVRVHCNYFDTLVKFGGPSRRLGRARFVISVFVTILSTFLSKSHNSVVQFFFSSVTSSGSHPPFFFFTVIT
jgi:hypothetical protein